MKGRFRFWGLYCGLILSFVLHYFATSQLKIYENHLWELFDSPKATIIMYLGNGLHGIDVSILVVLELYRTLTSPCASCAPLTSVPSVTSRSLPKSPK